MKYAFWRTLSRDGEDLFCLYRDNDATPVVLSNEIREVLGLPNPNPGTVIDVVITPTQFNVRSLSDVHFPPVANSEQRTLSHHG